MDNSVIISITQTFLVLILELMAPVLVIATIVGLVISIFQTVTQIQESTLTFVPKVIACVVTLIVLLPWMVNVFIERTNDIFAQIPSLIR